MPALKITDAFLTVEGADLLLQRSSIFILSYNISKMSKHPEILWAQRSSATDESKVSLSSGDAKSSGTERVYATFELECRLLDRQSDGDQ